jgi:hypothetical protein
MAYIVEVDYFNCFILKDANNTFHVEESRIKGGFNNSAVDYGVRAHITDDNYKEQDTRVNTLIYSGIYNSRTGVNNTNQFPIDKPITLSVDVQQGGIYKLFAEDQVLNIFQEEKVRYVPIDKDIIYTAEGVPLSTTTKLFLGDVVSYGTNYGIGKNPESFAYYAGRKYFVDKNKGSVLRLSRDGITEISNYGMRSYFRDNLRDATYIVGAWDMYNKDYVLSIQGGSQDITLAFDEGVNGWTSRFSYIPQMGGSLDGKFYTFKNCDIYEHYSNSLYNTFYGTSYNSEVEVIFNLNPSTNKNFLTINYEGSKTWNIDNIVSEHDTGIQDTAAPIAAYYLGNEDLISSSFKLQDGKFFCNILNNSIEKPGEVVFGGDVSGIKGYFAKMKIKTSDTGYQELFSVSTNYNVNTY